MADDDCSLLIGHPKRLYLMYVQLVIFHFFYLHSFPLSFLFLREGGNLNSFEIQGEHQGIPHEDGCHQILRGGGLFISSLFEGGGAYLRGGAYLI